MTLFKHKENTLFLEFVERPLEIFIYLNMAALRLIA